MAQNSTSVFGQIAPISLLEVASCAGTLVADTVTARYHRFGAPALPVRRHGSGLPWSPTTLSFSSAPGETVMEMSVNETARTTIHIEDRRTEQAFTIPPRFEGEALVKLLDFFFLATDLLSFQSKPEVPDTNRTLLTARFLV